MSGWLTYPGNEQGVAAIEFALIAPVLILLMVGIFEFGTYTNATMRLENTARAAAEYVFQGGNPDNIQSDIIAESNLSEEEQESVAVAVAYVCECRDGEVVDCDTGGCFEQGDYVRRFMEVDVGMEYTPAFNWPGLPGAIDLGGFVRLQVSN